MYEELIERLREYPDREETAGGYVEIDWQDLLDAADAIELLAAQLAALQSENADLREMAKAGGEGPCGLCRYNPPSSCDGKPCTMCPAEAALGGGGDG